MPRKTQPDERPAPPPPAAPPQANANLSQVLIASRLVGYALSARAILLLAIAGAFVLACMAMARESQTCLYVLIAYSLLTIVPVAVLEVRKRS